MSSDLTDLVCQLVKAENECERAKADSILAQNFTAITRARGEEQNRDDLLNEIENPKNPNIHRIVDVLSTLGSGDIVVVRSVVTTTDQADSKTPPKRFRNTHVFDKQQGTWLCVAWQVTELKQAL